MTNEQIVALIKRMLDSNAIGLYPQRVENGADLIVCPACGQSTKVQGYASGMHALADGQHDAGCQLMKLKVAVESGAPECEIIGRAEELIRETAIALYPQPVDNGADCIVCPACQCSTTVKGYAGSMRPLDAGKHEPGCEAIELAEAIFNRP